MLKKQNRLKKRKDFDLVFKNKVFLRSSFFVLGARKNNLESNRFGVIISKKTVKKAVLRNKIKRKIRAIVYQNEFTISPTYDIAIILNKKIINKSFNKIEKELIIAFKKVKNF